MTPTQTVKLCECGCGDPAPLAHQAVPSLGLKKGDPRRFINGHQTRGRKFPTRASPVLTPEHRANISAALSGHRHPRWRGGRHQLDNGYFVIWSGPGQYEYEHRLVMAARIGRPLADTEIVHHVNGDKTDNRPENLWLFPDHRAHTYWHALLRTGRPLGLCMAAVAVGHKWRG